LPGASRLPAQKLAPIGHTLSQLAFDPMHVDSAESLSRIKAPQFSTEMGTPMLAVTKGLRQGLHIARDRNGRDELGLFGLQLPNFGLHPRTSLLDGVCARPQLS
jgi:hypothetical protein